MADREKAYMGIAFWSKETTVVRRWVAEGKEGDSVDGVM